MSKKGGKKGGKRGAGLFALNKKRQAGQQEGGTGGGDTDREGFRSADTDYLGRSVGAEATEAEAAGREEAGRQGRKAEEEPGFQLRRRRDADAAAKETSAQ